MISTSAEVRYKFVQAATPCPTEDMVKAINSVFDELQLSLSEEEILHPSEECHNQKWYISRSQIFDFVNSYHVFCKLCKKHFYSRSVPTDINSFFQNHINSEYHRELRDLQFPRCEEMFTWEKKWITGRCNVCQMSGLCAFVRDINGGPIKLLEGHYCIGNLRVQEHSEEILRKISLLKKYCKLSIFRDKFIKPLDEGSACLICCTKIPFSVENAKVHLGSLKHLTRFFWLMWNEHKLSPKDLLNGFNLEMVTRWIYGYVVELPEKLESTYENYRLECFESSSSTLDLDFSRRSGHYCPQVIEKVLDYHPSDFTRDGMCLLCDQPILDAHFDSAYHKSKLANLAAESFGNYNRYEAFCENRTNRLRSHVNTIEKYKHLKEGTRLQSLKVGPKSAEYMCMRKLFLKRLSRIKNPPSNFLNQDHVCEVCDIHVPAPFASNHATEFKHLYYSKKWEELESRAKDARFFEPFQKIKNCFICLLCGVYARVFNFFPHLKGTLHTKRFEWYCTLKNEIPISSAIEVKYNLSVVCYLCDNFLLKTGSKREFKINLRSVWKHWPCPLTNNREAEIKESLNASKNVLETCPTCSGGQGAHKRNCATNSLNWKRIECAISGIVNAYEGAVVERVLHKTMSTIQDFEAPIAADGSEERQEAACECEKQRPHCNCGNANDDLTEPEAVEKKYEKIETNHLKNDKTNDKKSQDEKEGEVLLISELKTASEKQSKESNDEIPYSQERHGLTFSKSKIPPMPPDLLKLLEEPRELLEFVNNLTAAATQASQSVEELEREKLVCATINSAVQSLFPQCRCYPFGSRLSGLMFSNSDLDVFLDCGGYYEGMENVPPCVERQLIHKVAKALRKKREIAELIIIGRARVPIVSFLHKPTDLHCDLSFKNALSVHNSLLVKFLVSLDSRVKCLIMFLKYWIKRNSIHGPPYFSSYAITMMGIFYLQQLKPPMVPTVEELQNAFIGRRLTIGGWNCSFSGDVKVSANKNGNFPLHLILQGFFNYFANFDYDKFAISPLDGKPLPREAFSRDGQVKLPMNYKRHILNFPQPLEKLVCQTIPICVIDPFDLSHVLTKSFNQIGLHLFKYYCRSSAEALKKGVSNVSISNEGNEIDLC